MVGSLVADYLVEELIIDAGFKTFASFAVNFAVSQVLVRTFAQDPSSGQQQDNGIRQQVPPSSTNSIPVVYGDAYLGGTFVDAVLSDDQTTMYYVLAVSCISPNGQFSFDTSNMYYGDRLITFKSSGNTNAVASLTDEAGNVDTAIATGDLLQIYLYKSNAAGTITGLNTSSPPSTVMGGSDISASYRWASSGRQMNGLAFAIVKLKYSRDAQTTQLEPITFKCSHYLNSTGLAKPGDVWYDYITNTVYGGAIGASYVDSASATALNTYSDQTITYTPSGGGSATQARYRINGVLNAGETVLNNLDRILTACDSWMAYQAATGQWSIVINKAESSSYSFDDTNIIGEIRVSATDITNSINQIEAKFPFKENRDQPEYVNLQTPSGLLYPNEPVNKFSTSFDVVNDSVQATYLANRILEQAREDLIVSFNTTYYGIQVDAGNVVAVTNSNYGWTNKLFRVMKVNEASLSDGTLGARLELNEYNADVYDDAGITQFTPVPNSGLTAPSYFSALGTPIVIASRPSGDVPSFDVRVTVPAVGRVTYIQLFYTTSATPSASDWILFDTYSQSNSRPIANSTNFDFLNEILPGGTYYFAYVVGNESSASVLSSSSTAFSWSPTPVSGNSSRICFARVASNPIPTSGSIVTSGSSSFPSSAQSLSTWGFSATWGASDPNPSSTDSLYQSDGIYDPVANQTTWTTPYISSLKVGALSAVSTNTGSLTISGTLQSNTAAISGTSMTGSGGVLYASGNFAFGDSSTNISYNGTQMTLNGNVVNTSNLVANAATVPAGAQLASNVSASGGTTTNVISISINSGGNPVWIIANIFVINNSGNAATALLTIRQYPGIIPVSQIGGFFAPSEQKQMLATAYIASPGSGTNTFTMEFAMSENYIIYSIQTTLFGLGIKR